MTNKKGRPKSEPKREVRFRWTLPAAKWIEERRHKIERVANGRTEMKDVWCETCGIEVETTGLGECPTCGAYYPDEDSEEDVLDDEGLGRAVNVLSILLGSRKQK